MATKSSVDELLQVISTHRDIHALVEGPSDVTALQWLGFTSVECLRGRPLYQVVEELKVDEIQLLMDLDRQGRMLFGKLAQEIEKRGISINNSIRDLLYGLPVAHIEGLASYVEGSNDINKA